MDAVVVAHLHPDHFDSYTASLLDHGLPPYVQGATDRLIVAAMGFEDVRVMSDEGSALGELTVDPRAGPAWHYAGARLRPRQRRGA